MFQEKTESRKQNIRKTVGSLALAFMLLSVTLAASVWFVVRSARTVSRVTQTEKLVNRQRRATDHLLAQLLNAGTQAETASLQYADNSELLRYLKCSEQVDTALHALKKTVINRAQLQRIDSLQILVWMRRDGTVQLVNALRKENHMGGNLQQQIEALKKKQPVTMQVEVPVVERGEQVVIERRKRGFFRRLGDAFRRAKDDTLNRTVEQHEVASDTAHTQVDIADTLAHMLTGVHHDMQRDARAHARRLYRRSDELRAASVLLSRRMAALVDNFTAAQQQLIAKTVAGERMQRRAAALKLGAMALLAIILSATLMLWLWRDIKRANHYRLALEKAKERTENLMKRREQLLLTISHDIKAPVNTMLGYLHLLPHQAAQQYGELKAIEDSAQHLLQLVMALLDYHKLENGGLSAHPQPAHLRPLLQDIAMAFEPMARQKGLQMKVELNVSEKVWVEVNVLRLRQIIENLLSNAIKYTASGSVSMQARWNGEAGRLQVDVTDTGCGMTQVDLDRIFAPFTRVRGSEGQEGTGLGLAITQKLVVLLGGTLTVDSELQQGSRFSLVLPLSLCEAESDSWEFCAEHGETASRQLPEGSVPDEICCAVLDDDVLQRQLTEAMLRNVLPARAEVKTFDTAEELLGWIDGGHVPTMVLTDIEMPGRTGYEVLADLRQRASMQGIPVVAMTSHLLVPVDDFKQRGFADVLFKPFTQNDLLRLFHNAHPVCKPAADVLSEASASSSHPFKALLAFAEGDREAEAVILKQFVSDCQTHLKLLTVALAQHDKAEMCRLAHKMLPTFTLISSPAVPALKALEARRTDPQWHDDDTSLARQVANELKSVVKALSLWVKPDEPIED